MKSLLCCATLACLCYAQTASGGILTTAAPGYSISWDGNEGDYAGSSAPTNLASAAGSSGAFGSSEYGGSHTVAHANDLLYGNSYSWLATSADTNPYIGVKFGALQSLTGIAWGRDNTPTYTDRALGTYTLQYTQVGNPGTATPETGNAATGWVDIGTVQYSAGGFNEAQRHEFSIGTTTGPLMASAVRVKVPDEPNFSNQIAIDEVELYCDDPRIPTSGLTAWHKADQGVHTISSKVDQWIDRSGNGNDLTIVAGDPSPTYQGYRPTLNSGAGFGGKDLVHFDGTDWLDTHLGSDIRTASDLGMLNSDYEVFVVMQSSTSQVGFPIAGNATEQYEIHTNGPGGARFIPTTGKRSDVGTTDQYLDGRAHILGGRVSAAGVGYARADGVDGNGVSGSFSTSDVYLNFGQRAGGGYRFNGDIAEVLIFDHALTPTERVNIETYLSAKWDTPYARLAQTGGGLVGDNVAAQSNGGTAFAKDVYAGGTNSSHQIDHLNNETYGNNESWLGASGQSFAGVAFEIPYTISSIAFGRDNGGNDGKEYQDRYLGNYTLQYTTVPDPDETTPDSDWISIASLTYDGVFPDATGWLRHLYRFDPIRGATGVRVLVDDLGQGWIAIDELEVGAVPEPASATFALLGLAGFVGIAFRRRRGL